MTFKDLLTGRNISSVGDALGHDSPPRLAGFTAELLSFCLPGVKTAPRLSDSISDCV